VLGATCGVVGVGECGYVDLISPFVSALHHVLGWVAIYVCGAVGLWGVAMYRRETLPRAFYPAVGVGVGLMLAQVSLGVAILATTERHPGDQHTFYGFVIAFTFAFAYFYKSQFRKRPALAFGLLLLFVMGLGLRGIATFGVNF